VTLENTDKIEITASVTDKQHIHLKPQLIVALSLTVMLSISRISLV